MTCPAQLSDANGTVTCMLPNAHHGDHGRGFLRWEDDGSWYAQRHISRDGVSSGLPYPEGEPW
ncbi:hypothetical protein ACGFNY_04960 [Streptomyces chartreusis]|uniref:hypothetical protein n=1 Tax=Streptomyces chartreusis TaxID=1969 RepID=UPI00370FFD59